MARLHLAFVSSEPYEPYVYNRPAQGDVGCGNQAVALFTFEADQPGDLGFKKGDIITVTKTGKADGWWYVQYNSFSTCPAIGAS